MQSAIVVVIDYRERKCLMKNMLSCEQLRKSSSSAAVGAAGLRPTARRSDVGLGVVAGIAVQVFITAVLYVRIIGIL